MNERLDAFARDDFAQRATGARLSMIVPRLIALRVRCPTIFCHCGLPKFPRCLPELPASNRRGRSFRAYLFGHSGRKDCANSDASLKWNYCSSNLPCPATVGVRAASGARGLQHRRGTEDPSAASRRQHRRSGKRQIAVSSSGRHTPSDQAAIFDATTGDQLRNSWVLKNSVVSIRRSAHFVGATFRAPQNRGKTGFLSSRWSTRCRTRSRPAPDRAARPARNSIADRGRIARSADRLRPRG